MFCELENVFMKNTEKLKILYEMTIPDLCRIFSACFSEMFIPSILRDWTTSDASIFPWNIKRKIIRI